MDHSEHIRAIKAGFIKNRKLLIAIDDETRQNIITVLMGNCHQLRVGDITAQTHLSRPAISHHMRILLDCGLVSLEKRGTKNYYSLNIGEEFQGFCALVNHIAKFKEICDSET